MFLVSAVVRVIVFMIAVLLIQLLIETIGGLVVMVVKPLIELIVGLAVASFQLVRDLTRPPRRHDRLLASPSFEQPSPPLKPWPAREPAQRVTPPSQSLEQELAQRERERKQAQQEALRVWAEAKVARERYELAEEARRHAARG